MGDFRSLNLIDLLFGNKKIEKFESEKKTHKRNKISSLAMKFGDSLLNFRDENGRKYFCVNVCYREKR
jgi:hypothetical protein